MLRVRVRVPVAQLAEHSLNGVQRLCTQSEGQATRLQGRCSPRCAHVPPRAAAATTERERLDVPAPHERVHVVHPLHSERSQLMGHASVLHARRCSISVGHSAPPCCATLCGLRKRSCVPPPHERVHAPHATVSHAGTLQSTGHGIVLHARSLTSAAQSLPSNCAAVTIERWRSCRPPPHTTLQVRQPPHSDVSQCSGQGCEAHARVSSRCGQLWPLN